MMSPQPESLTSARRSRVSRDSSAAGGGEAEGRVKQWAVDAARKRVRRFKEEVKYIASFR